MEVRHHRSIEKEESSGVILRENSERKRERKTQDEYEYVCNADGKMCDRIYNK